MIPLTGAMLAGGILLSLAPWLWPAGVSPRAGRREGRLRKLLDAAGFAHAPSARLPIVAGISSLACGAVVWLATGLVVVAGLAMVAGVAAPFSWLRTRARRLRRARRQLWPDVCELLVASVRAGMSLPEAVSTLAVAGPPPLRPAFARFASDISASGHFDSAALRLKSALGDPVADRIVETLRMARQVGGTELTPVLRALAASVRADSAVRGEVEARQSWIRGAAVLGVVAPWVVLGLLATRPEGMQAYASAEGMVLVVSGAAVSVVAYRLMMRWGRLPEPQRWFG